MLMPPLTNVALAAAAKPPGNLRAFAAGQIAHVAIQTLYRIEHPGHFIITERLATLGDNRLTTLRRFGDLFERGNTIAKAAKQSVGTKAMKALTRDDLASVLAYLLDFATNQDTKRRLSRKRFDIVDFGILGSNALWEAYEIKSSKDEEIRAGRAYIVNQAAKFQGAVAGLRSTLAAAFNLHASLDFRLIRGVSWPQSPRFIPVWNNILCFWLQEPGVICYTWWKGFRRVKIKEMYAHVRATAEGVRKAVQSGIVQHLSDDIKFIALSVAAIGAIAIGYVLAEAALALAAAETVGAAAPEAAMTGAKIIPFVVRAAPTVVAATTTLATKAAAAPPQGSNQTDRISAALAAVDALYNFEDRKKTALVTAENLPGGVGPTQSEVEMAFLAHAIAEEFVFRYAITKGQGSDLLDDSGMAVLREIVEEAVQRLIDSLGLEQFLKDFGETELSQDTAIRIADVIITAGAAGLNVESYPSLLPEIMRMTVEDIEDSLPEGADPQTGELLEV